MGSAPSARHIRLGRVYRKDISATRWHGTHSHRCSHPDSLPVTRQTSRCRARTDAQPRRDRAGLPRYAGAQPLWDTRAALRAEAHPPQDAGSRGGRRCLEATARRLYSSARSRQAAALEGRSEARTFTTCHRHVSSPRLLLHPREIVREYHSADASPESAAADFIAAQGAGALERRTSGSAPRPTRRWGLG